jgi:hypothetical protein
MFSSHTKKARSKASPTVFGWCVNGSDQSNRGDKDRKGRWGRQDT